MDTGATRTILCIDDDHGTLDYHRALLERHGYEVLTTSSPQRGLEIATGRMISVVIVDYHMPEMTGDEVAAEIKRVKPKVPIVMVSSDDAIPERVLNVVDAFVSKNEVADCLLPAILSFCGENSPGLQESTSAGD